MVVKLGQLCRWTSWPVQPSSLDLDLLLWLIQVLFLIEILILVYTEYPREEELYFYGLLIVTDCFDYLSRWTYLNGVS